MKRYVFLTQDGAIHDVGLSEVDQLIIKISPVGEEEPGIQQLMVDCTAPGKDLYQHMKGFAIAKGERQGLLFLQEGGFETIDKERHTGHVSVNVPDLLRRRKPEQLRLGV